MDMLRLALRPGLASPRSLPRLLFADELERLNATAWLAFERVLAPQNRRAGRAGQGRGLAGGRQRVGQAEAG